MGQEVQCFKYKYTCESNVPLNMSKLYNHDENQETEIHWDSIAEKLIIFIDKSKGERGAYGRMERRREAVRKKSFLHHHLTTNHLYYGSFKKKKKNTSLQ